MTGNLRTVLRGWIALTLSILVGAACSSDEPASPLEGGCLINTDCNSPLVCAFRRCHVACTTARDCDPGQRCVTSDRPFRVCQLGIERSCAYNSACPSGQTCGVDGQCREQCVSARDCFTDQLCVSSTCADRSELTDGGALPVAEGGVPIPQACALSSDCADPLVCRGGICSYECVATSDCPAAESCVEHKCRAPVCPDVDAGAVPSRCEFNSNCPAPLICRDGQCTCECVSNNDCSDGNDCIEHRCRPSGTVGPEGGTVTSLDGRLTIVIPPGALKSRVPITIGLAEDTPSGAIGPAYQLGPIGTLFSQPVTINYTYEAADLGATPADELHVATAHGVAWLTLGAATTNATTRTVSGQTTHFSVYAVVRGVAGVTCRTARLKLLLRLPVSGASTPYRAPSTPSSPPSTTTRPIPCSARRPSSPRPTPTAAPRPRRQASFSIPRPR